MVCVYVCVCVCVRACVDARTGRSPPRAWRQPRCSSRLVYRLASRFRIVKNTLTRTLKQKAHRANKRGFFGLGSSTNHWWSVEAERKRASTAGGCRLECGSCGPTSATTRLAFGGDIDSGAPPALAIQPDDGPEFCAFQIRCHTCVRLAFVS